MFIEVLRDNLELDPVVSKNDELLLIRIMGLPKADYGTHQIPVLSVKFHSEQTYKSWVKYIYGTL